MEELRWREVWKPVFDSQPISSIGSIAVSPSNPNVIYVGSGEANIRGNVAAGNGIYKSSDAGKSWTHVWKQEGQIGTIIVHPKNPDVSLAAVLGHAFGANPQRGVYKTAILDKAGALEEKLHNPRAKITYDILAQQGGARLYSQLTFLYETSKSSDGSPTQGMREVFAEENAELARYEQEFQNEVLKDLGALNELARKQAVPHVIVP